MAPATASDLSPTTQLAQALIQKPSVTPADEGCQQLLTKRLQPLGFHCEQINRGSVTNLWATKGSTEPLVVFAGHTDVVPTGPLEQWQIPPFQGEIREGMLHGRGAADMKGSIAAFICACESFLKKNREHRGAIGLLITSDEEGPATDGTVAVLDVLAERGQIIDHCIVGEPTSTERLGDVIKVGRRGSLGAKIIFHGVQGHIAYPHLARNPIHLALPALQELIAIEWDQGNDNFQPTSLQLSNIHGGTGASNVIPGSLEVSMNFRFSPEVTEDYLRKTTEALFDRQNLEYSIDWRLSGQPFETQHGELIKAVSESIRGVTGYSPETSTSGGTSDGRFIAPTGAQVVELGPINATIHKVNECISIEDLELLTHCYEGVLDRLLIKE
ncbi:MAG: succinyl-diaminopimelate desuccinylase [Acidiferrobacterales bacterium]|nr:succinyl-diaminopimelate desuccinylase [Acidiferrobacterales bacterium]